MLSSSEKSKARLLENRAGSSFKSGRRMRATAALADLAPAILDRSNPGATKAGPGLGLPSVQNVGRSTVTIGGYLKSFSLLWKADGVMNGGTGGERSLLYRPCSVKIVFSVTFAAGSNIFSIRRSSP